MSAPRPSQPTAHRSPPPFSASVLILACAALAATSASAATLTRGPYLQLLTTSSVTIVWQTDATAECSVVLHPIGGSTRTVRGTTSTTCAVAVTNLTPGTRYAYTPRADAVPLTGESVFQTDSPTLPFTFIVLGDSGTGGTAQYAINERMLATRADFIIHTGDMIYETGAPEEFDPKLFWPYRDLLRRLVLWPTLGNHDVDLDGGVAWRANFYTPANNAAGSEKYYSFDYGNAHFVVLDSNANTSPGSPQYTFADQDLGTTDATWKFVAFHHPIYSSGRHGSELLRRQDLVPLFDAHGVDLVLMGHDHDYERTLPLRADAVVEPGAGTVYLVSGGGGQIIRPVGTSVFTAYSEAVFHFTRIAVDGGNLLLQMIRDDGTVRDTMTFAKGTPGPAPQCGDGLVNQPGEQCDGTDRPGCAGACESDCTCAPICGDGVVNQPTEACDRSADAACPGLCLADCGCGDSSRFVTLAPVADTFIEIGAEATWDHGAATQIAADFEPRTVSYLRFDLSAVTAPIVQATLSLHSLNGSFDGGTVYPVGDSSWVEGDRTGVDVTSADGPGLKWIDVDTNGDSRVDARDTSPWVPDLAHRLGAAPSAAGQRWAVDVTAALQAGAGLYTLAVKNDSSDGSTYATRENTDPAKRPRLRLEIAPPPTTTTSSSTTMRPSTTLTSTTTTFPPTTTTVTATTTSSTTTTLTSPATALVEADVSVRQDSPGTNFGAGTVLEVDAATPKRTYLRVRATGIGMRRVERALLRLQVANAVDAESDAGGRVSVVNSCSWDERMMTWTTQPAIDGPMLDAFGAVAVGAVAEFDLTTALSADGTYCFAVDTLSANMVKYVAREAGAGGPQIALTLSAPATTTTTTSSTSTTSSSTLPPTTTTTSSTTTTTAPPALAIVEADVSVREEDPGTRYGASTILEVDADTRKITYLRVRASGIGSRFVTRALLRLKVANTTDAESNAGGRVVRISSCSWDERAMTWNSRPPVDGAELATAGPVAIGDLVEFDVTPAIPGDGTHCLAIDTPSSNMVKYIAREAGAGGPQVALTVSATPPTTTTSSSSTTTSSTTSSTTTSSSSTTSTSTSTTTTSTSTTSTSTTSPSTSTTTTSSSTSTTTSSTGPSTTTTTTTSSTTTTTSPPALATVEADVSVREENPGTSYGPSTILEVDADTRKITYLRVRASGIGSRFVTRALLRLKIANTTDAESNAGGRVARISSCSWDELAMTWNSRPPVDGAELATAGPVAIGELVEFDVTPAIPGDGPHCLAVDTPSSNMVKYIAREAGAGGPQVALTISATPPTTTTTTSSSTSTTTSSTTTSSTSTTTTSTTTPTAPTTTTTSASTTTTTLAPQPRRTVLRVAQGYDEQHKKLLSAANQLDEWQLSDNHWGKVEHKHWTSLDFTESAAFLSGHIRAARVCVEHYVDSGFVPGTLVWQARTGALANPVRLSGVDPADDATAAPLFISKNGEGTACWEARGTLLSAFQADPTRVNSLVVVIRNDDQKKNAFADTARIEIDWVP